ncbi:hypothetical protein CNEO4_50005 [Clostridium neonatale]|uniref:Uncharacterized protein n=1 Tax=Clostridium neonatale TaxID=137838 RepID=A0AAD1YB20_9CLOT|nr:hypothetical protein CNEO_130019 [Clostridium neonatale]CAI3192641.1 hypothetical protein CNEO2_120086 [Clostridium neonatale]CAI3195244.1 hypothetical protein CNEO2_120086 [Clostridium neonatale]CAI3198770.1 hypothetical protein CNEO2_200071 [Clostridium neonatale]CAI3201970.1 hypothetical protein CNEO2_240071 [Clostridium neonatale]
MLLIFIFYSKFKLIAIFLDINLILYLKLINKYNKITYNIMYLLFFYGSFSEKCI